MLLARLLSRPGLLAAVCTDLTVRIFAGRTGQPAQLKQTQGSVRQIVLLIGSGPTNKHLKSRLLMRCRG